MKKFIILLIILLFAGQAFGATYASKLDRVTDADMRVAVERAGLTVADFGGGGLVHSGETYYVDSVNGSDTGRSGKSWELALATAQAAVTKAAAAITAGTDKGRPIIYIREGHNEALGAAGLTTNIKGLKIRGLGFGADKPTFDYDTSSSAAGFIVSALTEIINLRFRPSTNVISTAIDITATGDGSRIAFCDFGFAESAAYNAWDEFSVAVNVTAAAENCIIEHNLFDAGAASGIAAIQIGAVSGITIQDNDMYGDYSTAVLYNVTTPFDNMINRRNLIFNGTMGGDGEINTQPAIEFSDSCGGVITDNRIVSDVATALLMRIADDMVFVHNFVSDTDGDEFSGSLEHGTTTPLNSVSAHSDG